MTTQKIPEHIEVDGVRRPTRNSEGWLIHATPEGIEAFWAWFGDSKIIDDAGRPMPVYHASTRALTVFDIERSKPCASLGHGFYFTCDERTLDVYAGGSGHVLAAYLRMRNPCTTGPMTASQVEAFFGALQVKRFPNGFDATESHEQLKENALADLRYAFGTLLAGQIECISKADWLRGMAAAGFDGIIGRVCRQPEYVAFRPEQIKSAFNLGTFDPRDPDIRHAEQEVVIQPAKRRAPGMGM